MEDIQQDCSSHLTHSLLLNISTADAHKVDVKEYCASIDAQFSYRDYRLYNFPNSDIYHKDWLDYVNSVLPSPLTSHSFMFVRDVNDDCSIHKDLNPPHRNYIYALNYVIDACETSTMSWYRNADGTESRLQYPLKPVVEIETVVVPSDRLLLIDTSTYHGVRVGNRERWCMSLRTEDSIYDPENPLSWENILQKYQEIAI